LLVEPNDPAALAAKIEVLLGDAALRERLAIEGRKYIEAGFDRRTNFGRLKCLLLDAPLSPSAEPARVPDAVLGTFHEDCIR